MDSFPDLLDACVAAINQQVTDLVAEARLQRLLFPPRARVNGDDWEGSMVRLQTGGQELRAEHLEVFFNLEDFGFGVQVVHRGHPDAPSGDAEGRILDGLEPGYGAYWCLETR